MKKRENGYYWVNNGDDNISNWVIAYWAFNYWHIIGVPSIFWDEYFVEIDETQIIRKK